MKAIIFDLDGTLIDSLEDIAVCMNQVLGDLNLPTYEILEYKNFVGGGVDILVENTLGRNYSLEIKNKVVENFKRVYDEKLHSKTKAYEGIDNLLEKLEEKNIPLAVLSNKPHEFTCKYVESLFSKVDFKEVHGQKKEIAKKPDPIAAINIAKSLNIKEEDIYFVGDTKVDMQTAKNAGMHAVGVLWGFRDEEELNENGADFIISKPEQLLEVIDEDEYLAIACHFYDEFEAACVKRKLCKIKYIHINKEIEIEDYVLDLQTKNKKEYVIFKNQGKIRLDKILEFNGLKANNYSTCDV